VLSTLVAILRWNLFTSHDLWEWINRSLFPFTQGELFDLDGMAGLPRLNSFTPLPNRLKPGLHCPTNRYFGQQ
jgi:hypothetical protein